MPRRVKLPGANELFRTHPPREPNTEGGSPEGGSPEGGSPEGGSPEGGSTGRVRHAEKITVYVSTEELIALDQARLTLRAQHGIAVDRGRLVREAIDLALADLNARGADCDVVKRLKP